MYNLFKSSLLKSYSTTLILYRSFDYVVSWFEKHYPYSSSDGSDVN